MQRRKKRKDIGAADELWASYQRLASVHAVGREIGVTGDTIHQRLIEAGYKLNNAKWSADEFAALATYYRDTPAKDFDINALAALLQRSYAAVAIKASRLGLGEYTRPSNSATKQIMREQRAGQWSRAPHPRGMAGKEHSETSRAVMSKSLKLRWITDKTFGIGQMTEAKRQQRSDDMVRRQATDPRMRKGYSRGLMGKRADLGNQHFRSSWEANYARYLSWQQGKGQILRWEFEPDTFWFEAIRRGVRSYLPDFKVWPISGEPYYVEVKGYMDQKSRTKLARMKKYHPGIKVVLFDAKAYKILEARMGGVIPGWESGKKRTEVVEPAPSAPEWLMAGQEGGAERG